MSGYLFDVTHKDAPAGCSIVVREPNQLQLDWDSKARPTKSILKNIEKNIGYSRAYCYKSRNARYHGVIELSTDIDNSMAVALQLSAGSDPTREFINLLRILQGIENPILLFRPDNAVELDIAK